MKAYVNYFKLNLISVLQYRLPAIAGILTQLFFGFVFIMIYVAFYDSNQAATLPMELNEVITYMWLQQAFYALIYPFYKDHELLNMIRNGNVAYELIRPQNFFWKYYFKILATKAGSVFLRCGLVLLVAFLLPAPLNLKLPISFGNFIVFMVALLLSFLLISALTVIVHLMTMFTLDSRGITTIYSVIADLFMGGIIPLPFFPNWLKSIANFLPFRFISDFPFRIYSGSITLQNGLSLILKAIGWIIFSIMLGLFISRKALRKAVIQGG